MSREILFRGKRVDNGEWVYGSLVRSVSRTWIKDIGSKTSLRAVSSDYADWRCVEVIPETVSQFIGLCDKNGKEVYENDHVNVWRDGSNRKFTVKWREEGVPMYILYPQPHNEDFWYCRSDMKMAWEVIGNKFDNPSLTEAI